MGAHIVKSDLPDVDTHNLDQNQSISHGGQPEMSAMGAGEEPSALFDRNELLRIASSMSHGHATSSSKLSKSESTFNIQKDYAAVDATSPEFDLNKWLQVVMQEVLKMVSNNARLGSLSRI